MSNRQGLTPSPWSNFFRTAGAAGLATAVGLGAQLLLLRELSEDDAGRFATLLALIYGLGLLGALGQGTLMARFYHQSDGETRDWRRDLWHTTVIAAVAITLSTTLVFMPLFDLGLLEAVFVLVASLAFAVTHCGGSMLAQRREYTASSLFVRLPNVLLAIPALVFLFLPPMASLEFLLPAVAGGFLISLAGMLATLRCRVSAGKRAIGWTERWKGLLFFGSSLSLVIPDRGLIAVAGAILLPIEVAALAAAASLIRLMDLVADSTGRVFSNEIARRPERLSWKSLAPVWLIAGVLAGGMLLVVPPVIHQFYDERFDSVLTIVPWLVAAAAITVIEVVPRGYLAYRGNRRVLVRHVAFQSAIAIIGLAGALPLARSLGLQGIALAGVSIAAARAVCTYYFACFFEKPRRSVSS